MPIFEYLCEQCGREFEELVFNQSKPVPCPECGSDKTNKLMSRCQFKSGGSGASDGPHSYAQPAAARSGCAGCSGGSCATCH